MADLARIKNNVRKMVEQNAPQEDIDGYIASEGVSVDQVRDFRGGGVGSTVDDFMRGAADTLSFGLADEISAGMGALTGIGGDFMDYSGNLAKQRERDAQGGAARLTGQIAGGVTGGAGLAKAGLSFGANAAGRGASLLRPALGSAADGAILGVLQGAGSGEGVGGRLGSAAVGGTLGGALGMATPYAIAGVQTAAKPLVAPIMARLRPQNFANAALGEGVERSGMSVDDIAAALARSQADDQGMFTVADAMGNSGQRMLSTVARTPNEARQGVVEALQQRQMGQGERLASSLARGFNAQDTAAQRAAKLGAERSALANVNYETARNSAGAVDVSGAIRSLDDNLTPGVNRIVNPGSGIADDSLEGVLRRARSLITDGKSVVSDFSAALRVKQDIDDMIGAASRAGRNNQVRLLSQVNSQLDAALERASPGYRAANDAFRAQSRTIDAVERGTAAASGRTRAADNIAAFNKMKGGEKMAFRAGYADPMIAKVESMSMSPTTNKARTLITEKTGQEFPAFAIPQRADRMGRQIAREQRMFETANAALGGSKTADNLADAAEMAKFDPSVMAKLLSGRPVDAVISAVTKAMNEASGMTPQVIARVAKVLMETDPAAARAALTAALKKAQSNQARQAIMNTMATATGAAGTGRVAAP